jgi:hypothetical protein
MMKRDGEVFHNRPFPQNYLETVLAGPKFYLLDHMEEDGHEPPLAFESDILLHIIYISGWTLLLLSSGPRIILSLSRCL